MTLRLRYIEIILWTIGPANNNFQRRTEEKTAGPVSKVFASLFLIVKRFYDKEFFFGN
jgi:hypothetical protein